MILSSLNTVEFLSEMSSPSAISVIIPVYNSAKYLAAAIESVLQQTLPPSEILVIDNGSSDDSVAIASRYAELRLDATTTRGPAAARNRGIELARGAFLAFLDADDLWASDKLARQMEAFQADPSLELCLSRLQNFLEPGCTRPAWVTPESLEGPWDAEQFGTILCRRTAFERVGTLDETLLTAEDLNWFARAKSANIKMCTLEFVSVYRRIHENNLSHQRNISDALRSLHRALKDSE